MNYRIIGIFISVFFMLFCPAVSGIIFDNIASTEMDELDKSEIDAREISVYMCSTGEIESMDFEEYICGVVMSEVPSNFEEEALKAMAVAIRSYSLRRLNNAEKDVAHFSADVCDDYSHCQGFISYHAATEKWGELLAEESYEKIKNAVDQTKGEVLIYNGTIADAVFHSSSSKKTESAKNVWGFDVPYLESVATFEECTASYMQYDADEFSRILSENKICCDFDSEPEKWISDFKMNENGRCESVNICEKTVTGRRMREIFNLKSTFFEIDYTDGAFIFTVWGNGHGVGMSQYGCNNMAEKGYDYREILKHYYSGTKIELY